MSPSLNLDFVTIVGIFFTSLLAFLGIFAIIHSTQKINKIYLGLYLIMLLIAYEIFYKTLIHSKLILEFPQFYIPGKFFNLLIYPTFLIFVLQIFSISIKKKKIYFYGMMGVFSIGFLHRIWQVFRLSESKKMEILSLFYTDLRPGPFNYWDNFGTLLKSTIIPLFFLIPTAYFLVQLRLKLKSQKDKLVLNLLSLTVLLYFLFTQSSNILYRVLFQFSGYSMIEWPVEILFLSIISFSLIYLMLKINAGRTIVSQSKYESSSLQIDQYYIIIQKAQHIITSEKLYLKPQTSQVVVAEKIGVNTTYLSQAVNHQLKMNFSNFLNQYRIEEAKQLLRNPKNQHLTLEAIGYKAGFKSKSAFFKKFKQSTGFTPKQYLNSTHQ